MTVGGRSEVFALLFSAQGSARRDSTPGGSIPRGFFAGLLDCGLRVAWERPPAGWNGATFYLHTSSIGASGLLRILHASKLK
jgi:hypothetical protein